MSPAEAPSMEYDAETIGADFEYVSPIQAPTDVVPGEGINGNELVARAIEVENPTIAELVQYKGGEPDDWRTEYSGDGYTYDGKFVRDEKGEVWAGADPEMLRQWENGEGTLFRLPDHQEVNGDEIKLYVTHIMRNQDNSVRFEIHSTTQRSGHAVESTPVNDWQYLDAAPVWQREALYDPEVPPDEPEEIAGEFSIAHAELTESDAAGLESSIEAATQEHPEESSTQLIPGMSATEYGYADLIGSLRDLPTYDFGDDEQPAATGVATEHAASDDAPREASPLPLSENIHEVEVTAVSTHDVHDRPVAPTETFGGVRVLERTIEAAPEASSMTDHVVETDAPLAVAEVSMTPQPTRLPPESVGEDVEMMLASSEPLESMFDESAHANAEVFRVANRLIVAANDDTKTSPRNRASKNGITLVSMNA